MVSLNSEKNDVLRQRNFENVSHPQNINSKKEDESKYDKLKTNYEEYVKTNFDPYEFENVSEELKEGIENLTGEGYVEEPCLSESER